MIYIERKKIDLFQKKKTANDFKNIYFTRFYESLQNNVFGKKKIFFKNFSRFKYPKQNIMISKLNFGQVVY